MNLDRDLREALAPLAGDPASDAARVMAALPPPVVSPPQKPIRRRPVDAANGGRPWLVFVGIAAVALAVGVAVGAWWSSSAAPVDKPKEEPPREQPKTEDKPPPMSESEMMMLMAFGALDVDEPGVGAQELQAGGYALALGSHLQTGEGPAGLYVYANDARVRLDRDTKAMVAADVLELEGGRAWFSTVTRPTPFSLRSGKVVVEGLGVELQVERRGDDLQILCLQGQAQVLAPPAPKVAIVAMQTTRVGADGVIAPPTSVGFAGEQTAWMVPMIRQQQDERELVDRIEVMVKAFAQATYRAQAAIELRRIGSRAVPQLFKAMLQRGVPADEQRQAAALIADLAEYSQTPWLFALLENDAGEVRAEGFRALARVGTVVMDDEEFWRSAPQEERERSLARWRARLR